MGLSDIAGNVGQIPSIISSIKDKALLTSVGLTGLSPFIFDIPNTTQTNLNSRLTQYPIVDGTIISDNYLNDTEEVQLEGVFAMYSVNDTLGNLNVPSQILGSKLQSLGSLGHLSNKQRSGLNKLLQTTENVTNQLSKVQTSVQTIAQLLSTSSATSRASKVFDMLRVLRDSKVMFSLDSNSYRIPNCVITSLSLDTDYITMTETVRLTVKRINVVKVKDFDKLQGEPQTLLQNAKDQITTQFNKIKSSFF